MERHPSVVARFILPPQAPTFVFPLVRVVEVEPHHIEVFRRAAELRLGAAREHVPRLELALVVLSRRGRRGRAGCVGGNTLITGSTWTMRARGSTFQIASVPAIAPRAQLPLQLVAAPARVRVDEAADIPRRPAQERDLVDGRVEGHLVGMIGHHPRDRTAVARESIDPGRREHIEAVGPAVVAERPDDLHRSRRPPHAASGRTMRSRMLLPCRAVASGRHRAPSAGRRS